MGIGGASSRSSWCAAARLWAGRSRSGSRAAVALGFLLSHGIPVESARTKPYWGDGSADVVQWLGVGLVWAGCAAVFVAARPLPRLRRPLARVESDVVTTSTSASAYVLSRAPDGTRASNAPIDRRSAPASSRRRRQTGERSATTTFRSNHPRFAAREPRRQPRPARRCARPRSRARPHTAQLALAWLLHRADDIVPIPGTRTPSHLDENLAAAPTSPSTPPRSPASRRSPRPARPPARRCSSVIARDRGSQSCALDHARRRDRARDRPHRGRPAADGGAPARLRPAGQLRHEAGQAAGRAAARRGRAKVTEKLGDAGGLLAAAEVSGPGFVNLAFSPEALAAWATRALRRPAPRRPARRDAADDHGRLLGARTSPRRCTSGTCARP